MAHLDFTTFIGSCFMDFKAFIGSCFMDFKAFIGSCFVDFTTFIGSCFFPEPTALFCKRSLLLPRRVDFTSFIQLQSNCHFRINCFAIAWNIHGVMMNLTFWFWSVIKLDKKQLKIKVPDSPGENGTFSQNSVLPEMCHLSSRITLLLTENEFITKKPLNLKVPD